MTKLPNKEFRQMVPLLREKDFYESEEPREISWPEYTLSQVEEASDVLDFIKESVDTCECPDRSGRVGRPLTNPRTLAKAVLICEALGFVERTSQGWLKVLGPYVGISEQLDDRVIGEAYDRLDVSRILRQVFVCTKESDGRLCGDGSGLEKSRKQNYEAAKKYASYMVSIIDSREIVQAFELGNRNEHEVMSQLITQVEGGSLRLDAGFNNRKLVQQIAELEMIPYIFPRRDNNLNGSLAWKTMYLELYYDVMTWLTEYHQRSHCESFHSSFKRKNRLLMKLRPLAQLNQVLARIILHNRRR
ncbi:MAG: transposase, partial [Candidatus Woesearchaeota archaeon]